MITDKDLAMLCLGIYGRPSSPPISWDYYDNGAGFGVCWGLKKTQGVSILVCRGSVTVPDWIRDVEAIAEWHADLGAHVHPGFNRGTAAVWLIARKIIRSDPWLVIGHSLGAAEADNITAYGILDGNPPAARVVFGEPKPGFANFAALVAKAPGRSYRNKDDNGHDIVTDVPVSFFAEPYERATPLIDIVASPPPYDGIDEFRYHHMELYAAAVPATPIIGEPA